MSVIIKGMDIPIDCLACRISCDKESYRVIGRPPKCPLTEAKTGDLISRADAIDALEDNKSDWDNDYNRPIEKDIQAIKALPSADAVSREDYHNLLTASNDIDRALREYQAKEEQLSAEVAPKIDHDRDWIIGCIKHDGFIKTDRFDKANQIILEALSAEAEWIPREHFDVLKKNYDMLAGLLKEAKARAIGAWIPCSERLPRENGVYIVSLEDAVYPWATFHNGRWFMLSVDNTAREFGAYEVIAWMPLPDSWNGGEEE